MRPLLLSIEERLAASWISGIVGHVRALDAPFGLDRAEGVLRELGLAEPLAAELTALRAARSARQRECKERDGHATDACGLCGWRRYVYGADAGLRRRAAERVLARVGGFESLVRWRADDAPLSRDAQRWYDDSRRRAGEEDL